MRWSQIRSTAFVALLLLVVVGSAVAPVGAVDDTERPEIADSEAEDEFPEEICTDVPDIVVDEVPFDQVIWIGDLPEELQPDNVPADLVTPRTVAAIVAGVTPNQCEVFDPNDPPYDPREDDVDPDGGADVVEETEEGSTLIIVNGTLNRSADGPGFEVLLEVVPEANGELDPEVRLNDGEKDYVVDPGVQYWDDGTVYLENDVVVIGKRVGVEYDCNGEECELDIRGTPNLVDYPAIPSHSDADHTSDTQTDEGDGTDGDDSDDADGDDSTDSTDASDGDDGDDTDSTTGTADADEGDGAPAGDGDPTGDGSDDGDETETADGSAATDQPARAGVGSDRKGFGAVLAGTGVTVAMMLGRRHFV